MHGESPGAIRLGVMACFVEVAHTKHRALPIACLLRTQCAARAWYRSPITISSRPWRSMLLLQPRSHAGRRPLATPAGLFASAVRGISQPAGCKMTKAIVEKPAGRKMTDTIAEKPAGAEKTTTIVEQPARSKMTKTIIQQPQTPTVKRCLSRKDGYPS